MLTYSLARCGRGLSLLRLAAVPSTSQVAKKTTWVVRRHFAPEPTADGAVQRDPRELQMLMRCEAVAEAEDKPLPPITVILLEDVEGIGHQFDVVEVERQLAHSDLLLTRKAVYASPFDLAYYGAMKEKMKDVLAARIRIPYEYIKVGRQLQALVVPLRVSMENPWTLNRNIVKTSLREVGVDMLDDAIFVPTDIKGPKFEIEAKLIRFYVVVGKQYVIPMIGRLSHISADESYQMLSTDAPKFPEEATLAKHGLRPEQPYYHKMPELDEKVDILSLMKARALESPERITSK